MTRWWWLETFFAAGPDAYWELDLVTPVFYRAFKAGEREGFYRCWRVGVALCLSVREGANGHAGGRGMLTDFLLRPQQTTPAGKKGGRGPCFQIFQIPS